MNTLDLEPQNLSERDLLIILITRVDYVEKEIDELKNDIVRRLDSLEERVRKIEDGDQRQRGFLAGADWVKTMLIGSIPLGGFIFWDKS